LKARACANGSTQRSYKRQEKIPMAFREAISITAAIEADQGRDVMTAVCSDLVSQ
jgi:hypothetical protein